MPPDPPACPLPQPPADDESAAMARMVAAQRIAIVGLSDDPERPSHGIAAYLLRAGKEILPVNPNAAEVLGRRCYASLSEVPGPIGVVNVFRRPEFCPEVARAAVAAGARGLWLQSGIRSQEARRIAEEAGMDFVEDRCIMVEHMRRLRSSPGPGR